MRKGITTLIATAVISASLALSAFAAGPVAGKVTKVADSEVTVAVEGAVPAWIKKGSSVSVGSGSPKVVSVQGNEVTLKMSKSKAAKMKVDSSVVLTESGDDELQGC